LIAFRTIGGTGNRMFIYAVASALLKQGRCTCVSSFKNLHYFKISVLKRILNFFEWYFILVLRKLKRVKEFDLRNGWEAHFEQLIKIEGNAIVKGYFQGLHYFVQFQNEIQKKYEIKEKYLRQYENYIAPYKNNKIAAIQIRRSDYLKFNDPDLKGPDLTLPLTYYTNLIEQIRKKDDFLFIVMSDDKRYIKEHFKDFQGVVISENNEIIDLQILIHADVCIISPSSFGWWGTWLNMKPEKMVFVPEYYLGFKVDKEYPVGMIPADWNKVKI
jgi:hypothetical protein